MTDGENQGDFMYVLFAAISGGIVSLSQLRWKQMPWDERAMTVFVGAVVGIYLAPWVAIHVLKYPVTNTDAICTATFVGAGASQVLMQPAFKWLKKKLGLGDEQ